MSCFRTHIKLDAKETGASFGMGRHDPSKTEFLQYPNLAASKRASPTNEGQLREPGQFSDPEEREQTYIKTLGVSSDEGSTTKSD